ncbi:MAG: 16S rRNA (guanine(966)-N(2))-methyltransferase RsmD [bacterium]|nr:16S rRNA (guanine(966)-N(2))-methyltransferase RsmD [bacterium]
MRIIAGRWRSRRSEAPPSRTTRPMPDRIKEAVFDILGARWGSPGAVPPLWVADLFAGSGSLGLEAVSRGARGCVFVERDRAALRVLDRNISALDADQSLRVVKASAWVCPVEWLVDPGQRLSLLLVDPPYRDSADGGPQGPVTRLLVRLGRCRVLADGAWLVLHHERRVQYDPAELERWALVDRREYGSAAVCFFQMHPPEATDQVPEQPTVLKRPESDG